MGHALAGFHHVKLPVGDVGATRAWFERVLGFTTQLEWVEDGVLRGVAMQDPDGTTPIALREDPDRATAMRGFDGLALGVGTRDDLEGWGSRLDDLGVPHGPIEEGRIGYLIGGLCTPDDLEIRLYTWERAS